MESLHKATKTFTPPQISQNAIVDLQVIVSDNSGVNPPDGYTKIDYDLNHNAKGKYIYLCYKKISVTGSSADPKPITALYVASGDNNNPFVPPDYTKIDTDLNEGAGGKFIYLCYTKDPAAIPSDEDGLPIRGIRIIGNKSLEDVVTPDGFTKLDRGLRINNMELLLSYVHIGQQLCTHRTTGPTCLAHLCSTFFDAQKSVKTSPLLPTELQPAATASHGPQPPLAHAPYLLMQWHLLGSCCAPAALQKLRCCKCTCAHSAGSNANPSWTFVD